ncbi:MAG TPA: hypothetical protein VFV70_12085 [Hyphomonadaceae bacterium]|nr:hypothetical protein [Hyphomonadaceae bacterium]
MRSLLVGAVLGVSACVSAPPTAPEKVVEQFMWDYTKAWNRHDSATIARDFYRTGPTVEEQTASLERSFANLRGQGYDHSDIFEIKACLTGADSAWAGMKFSRLKQNGEPLPPKDRASSYTLKKFDDGWRITRVGAGGVSADQPLACPAVSG